MNGTGGRHSKVSNAQIRHPTKSFFLQLAAGLRPRSVAESIISFFLGNPLRQTLKSPLQAPLQKLSRRVNCEELFFGGGTTDAFKLGVSWKRCFTLYFDGGAFLEGTKSKQEKSPIIPTPSINIKIAVLNALCELASLEKTWISSRKIAHTVYNCLDEEYIYIYVNIYIYIYMYTH